MAENAPMIPSTNDSVLDLAIDILLRPGTTRAQRDVLRHQLSRTLRGKASRLLPDPDPNNRFRYSDHIKAKAWSEQRRLTALETI